MMTMNENITEIRTNNAFALREGLTAEFGALVLRLERVAVDVHISVRHKEALRKGGLARSRQS